MAVLVLAAAACGGDDDAADIFGDVDDAGGGDGAVVADDSDPGGDGGGSGELDRDPSAASGETEGGIPYPAEGLDVLADAGVEIAGQRQLHYPVDRFDELVAFYDDYVDGLGGQSGRAEVAGAVSWQVFADDGTLSLITVEPEFETRLGGEPITVTFVLLVDG
ncbi:MAG: hypothetical protein AAGA90_22125 [Actinomycetota bacterium]